MELLPVCCDPLNAATEIIFHPLHDIKIFWNLEQDIGFEPMTFSLATRHSTTELTPLRISKSHYQTFSDVLIATHLKVAYHQILIRRPVSLESKGTPQPSYRNGCVRLDSNQRPRAYETRHLPLIYAAIIYVGRPRKSRTFVNGLWVRCSNHWAIGPLFGGWGGILTHVSFRNRFCRPPHSYSLPPSQGNLLSLY